jgi:hypothetical protein
MGGVMTVHAILRFVLPTVFALLVAPTESATAANCSASYAIDLTVDLGYDLTQGNSGLMVELRQGFIGGSKSISTELFVGRTGIVVFSNMCAGLYFIAIGNGAKVAVGPSRLFTNNQHVHTSVHVTSSAANIDTMSRDAL